MLPLEVAIAPTLKTSRKSCMYIQSLRDLFQENKIKFLTEKFHLMQKKSWNLENHH